MKYVVLGFVVFCAVLLVVCRYVCGMCGCGVKGVCLVFYLVFRVYVCCCEWCCEVCVQCVVFGVMR